MKLPTEMNLDTLLSRLNACPNARAWAAGKTIEQAWAECDRGDWLLWFAVRVGVDRRKVVLAACACARTVLGHVPAGEDRPRVAIETAEAWCRGEATIEEVRAAANAANAANAASRAAYAYAAAYAASRAAYADAAYAYAYAAYADAAYAAYAAYADAANAADAYAVYAAYAAAVANLVRTRISLADVQQAVEAMQ